MLVAVLDTAEGYIFKHEIKSSLKFVQCDQPALINFQITRTSCSEFESQYLPRGQIVAADFEAGLSFRL